MAFTWQTSSIEILRNMIGDVEETPAYSDDRLERLLVVSAFQVTREASFPIVYTVDIEDRSITPDPSDTDTKNEDFINLMTIKAACILDQGAARLAAGNAFAGKDMNAVQFDFKGVADSTIKLLKEGWCKVYREVLYDYVNGNGNLGAAICGPFRTLTRWW